MLWPALRALSSGDLSEDQVAWLRQTFALTEGPRTEGPAADISLAHRKLTDGEVELVLDLSRLNTDGWVFTLFQTTADRPTPAFLESQRAAFRAAIDHLNLHLIEIEPPAKADEVLVSSPDPAWEAAAAFDRYWNLPDDLDLVWRHLGLVRDAPREVKEVKLRELMRDPVWHEAPANVRRQAQEFLDGH
ncbi:hypothetical protein [Kribbella sp. HUAS MG21]|uniref:Uncharacterized protein n=1 Tax=Kribbella sp. HUAS MG21 TaxID=3160966 RepID=A0AAU7T416_9ACTN